MRKLVVLFLLVLVSQFVFAVKVGQKAEDFKVKDFKGRMQSLSKYRGKVVLMKFWAEYCYACKKNFKKTQKLYKEFARRGLIIFAVCVGATDPARRFLKRNGYKTHVNIDGRWNRQFRKYYRPRKLLIPFEILISKKGVVLWKGHPANLRRELIRKALRE